MPELETPPAPPPAPAFDPQAAIAGLQQAGYHVYQSGAKFNRVQAEADPFLKTIVAPVIAERIGEVYSDLDRDILESTGIPKNQGEKTYEYAKRTAAQLKDQIKQAPDVNVVKQEYETKLTDTQKALAEVSLIGAIRGLKLNVATEAMEDQQELLLMRALSLPHRIEGRNIVFQKYSDDGKTLIDIVDPTTNKPLSPSKFLEGQFKNYLAVPEVPPVGPGKPPKPADTNKAIPTTIDQIGAELLLEGFMPGPDFSAEVKKRQALYAIPDKK